MGVPETAIAEETAAVMMVVNFIVKSWLYEEYKAESLSNNISQ
jgi:hypothetical protein